MTGARVVSWKSVIDPHIQWASEQARRRLVKGSLHQQGFKDEVTI